LREIHDSNIQEFIAQPLSVLIFSSPWCAACKKIISSVHALPLEAEDRIAIGVCDISENPNTASLLQVFSVPAVIIFKNGEQIKKLQGSISEKTLTSAVKDILCL